MTNLTPTDMPPEPKLGAPAPSGAEPLNGADSSLRSMPRRPALLAPVILLAAVASAAFVAIGEWYHHAETTKRIDAENHLKMRSAVEHIEEYFHSAHSTLLYVSLDDDIAALNPDARDRTEALFEHERQRHHLREMYVVQRDSNGGARPFLDFELEERNHDGDSVPDARGRLAENAAFADHIRRFASASAPPVLLSQELLLAGEFGATNKVTGLVCSVPIHNNGRLTGIVAGVIPVSVVRTVLDRGAYDNMAILVNERGEMLGCEEMPEPTRDWFRQQLAAKGAARFFDQAGQGFLVGDWRTLWTPINIPSELRWWLVYQYPKTPSAQRNSFLVFAEDWGLGVLTTILGVVLVILIRILARRHEEQSRHLAEREKLIAELKEALAEVKQLTGLLPICASCKKIRDDKGYWNQIEGYIQAHTEALFSHGICPDCAKQLYPNDYKAMFPDAAPSAK